MDFTEYQAHAARTSGANEHLFQGRVDWKTQHLPSTSQEWIELKYMARAQNRLATAAMGLAGEAGELTDYLKKVLGHGHPLDLEHVKKELGDVQWYIAEVASCLGIPLDAVATHNVEKLQKRYAGQFSTEKSLARVDCQ